jgi:hypothetical protein
VRVSVAGAFGRVPLGHAREICLARRHEALQLFHPADDNLNLPSFWCPGSALSGRDEAEELAVRRDVELPGNSLKPGAYVVVDAAGYDISDLEGTAVETFPCPRHHPVRKSSRE